MIWATADINTGTGKKDPFRNWPKGLIGFLGFGYLITAIVALLSFFHWDTMDVAGLITIIGTALVCVLLGVWALKYDYKRLTKVYTQRQGST